MINYVLKRKRHKVISMIVILCFCALFLCSCGESVTKASKEKNFLGGFGNITSGAYSSRYMFCFFEDDLYYYYDCYKINKNTGRFSRLCEKTGCDHSHPDCIEYQYRNKIYPGTDRIYFVEDRKLYEINCNGEKKYIEEFKVGAKGNPLDESVRIDEVLPLNQEIVVVYCGDGSCIYHISTGDRIYTNSRYVCADESEVFYYEESTDQIIHLSIKEWKTEPVPESNGCKPICYLSNNLYFNSNMGSVGMIGQDGKISPVLSNAGIRYNMICADQDSIFAFASDVDPVTGEYSWYDWIFAGVDGSDPRKLKTDFFYPGMEESTFSNHYNNFFMKQTISADIREVTVYNRRTGEWNTYKNTLLDEENSARIQVNPSMEDENLTPKKQYIIGMEFFAKKKDRFTGELLPVSQEKEPFAVNGSSLQTTISVNVDVEGDYPKEGNLYFLILCDGILQKSSVGDSDEGYIHSVPYVDQKNMVYELRFTLTNASPNGQIDFCWYLSDSVITNNFSEYTDHHENINVKKFAYRLVDGYDLSLVSLPIQYSNVTFADIYPLEEGENSSDVVPRFEALSGTPGLSVMKERWNLNLDSEGNIYIFFYNGSHPGQYDLYLLIDDVPYFLQSENYPCRVGIDGDFDGIRMNAYIFDAVKDGKKHNAKLLIYDRGSGMIRLGFSQIIQLKE